MSRRPSTALLALSTVALTIALVGDPVAADAPVVAAPDAVATLTYDAAAIVGREAGVIDALGAFDDDAPIRDLLVPGGPHLAPDATRSLRSQLEDLERQKADAFAALVDADLRLSPVVVTAMQPITDADLAQLVQGRPVDEIRAYTFVHAVHHLVSWAGAGPGDPADVRPPESANRLGQYLLTGRTAPQLEGRSEGAAPTGQPPATALPRAAAASPLADADSSGISPIAWAAAGLATVLAGVALLHRRRRSSGSNGLADLVDLGRRLTAVASAEDVERRLVSETIRLVGADDGAFIRCTGTACAVAHETSRGLVRVDGLSASVLQTAIADGAERRAVGNDPAFDGEHSMLAVPVTGDGTRGVIVAVRRSDHPFDDDDLAVAAQLRPLFESVLDTASVHDEMRTAVLTDPLTDVANRRALDQRLADETDDLVVIMVDLDRFKSINDTYGHDGGDQVLRTIAARLRASVSEIGDVYRFGGEEFAIVIATDDLTWATEIAEGVRRDIAATPVDIGATSQRITASIGVALGAVDDVVRRADTALYEAKRAGRDRVVVAPSGDLLSSSAG